MKEIREKEIGAQRFLHQSIRAASSPTAPFSADPFLFHAGYASSPSDPRSADPANPSHPARRRLSNLWGGGDA
uniref:Uncharacterized protein n=1 Tax=Picea glauca TaxID=3330 RepID=A0A124GMV6_PICGL|nr:hypothetical protein ABT39_MTgene6351 [Picea glauca]